MLRGVYPTLRDADWGTSVCAPIDPAWRIVCSDVYLAVGFVGTIMHSDNFNVIDAPNHCAFAVKEEGAAAQLGALHDFFTALPFWQMQPAAASVDSTLVLAESGKVRVAYLPQGGAVSLDFCAGRGTLLEGRSIRARENPARISSHVGSRQDPEAAGYERLGTRVGFRSGE